MTDVLASEYDVDTDTFIRPAALAALVDVLTVVEKLGSVDIELHTFYNPQTAMFHWGKKSSHCGSFEESNLQAGTREDLKAALDASTLEIQDRDKMVIALRTLDAFDYEATVISRYDRVRRINHQLESMGSQLSGLGEFGLAGAVWTASKAVMDRRHELHKDFIAAKNFKGHGWVADPVDTMADERLDESVAARAEAAEAVAFDWAAIIVEETATHELQIIFGADGRDSAFFTCTCGHRQNIPAMTTYQNGWHTEYDEVLFRAPFYTHQTEATAAAVAALIKESQAWV